MGFARVGLGVIVGYLVMAATTILSFMALASYLRSLGVSTDAHELPLKFQAMMLVQGLLGCDWRLCLFWLADICTAIYLGMFATVLAILRSEVSSEEPVPFKLILIVLPMAGSLLATSFWKQRSKLE